MAPSDFLPNSESDNFLEEVKELREISKIYLILGSW
jgi:acyl-[acyl-carrier-protein] desaturase